MTELGERAKAASVGLACAGSEQKNNALRTMAASLEAGCDRIIAANLEDLASAEKNGISPVMADRLRLTPERVSAIAAALVKVAGLPDPIGETVSGWVRPNGLKIYKLRVPLGVIGIIYESRPNVTVDAAGLCLKSGNACILRGGREAITTNRVLSGIMREAIAAAGLPEDCVLLVEDISHESARAMMELRGLIDVLIPRGGAGLIKTVAENSKVPVIETGAGNCHVYVDEGADISMAAEIIYNAKCSRPSVCNAAETLLVHKDIAGDFLPVAKALLDEKKVELRGCPVTRAILGDCVVPATEDDWYREYNDYILAVRVVDSLDAAIEHIDRYSTGHSEAIVTQDYGRSQRFLERVNSAAVYVNASTRFTDGEEFGLGAEIGISTQKLHARGPMGLKELTTTKYIVLGSGQIR